MTKHGTNGGLYGLPKRIAMATAAAAVSLVALSAPALADGALIGVVFPGQNQFRWTWETKTLTSQAEANGDKVIVQFSNESVATQKTQVESMIQRGVKVLILGAIDANAGGDMVKAAQAQGIKVITYDRGVVGAKPDFFVVRNNYDLGVAHIQSAIKAVPCGKYAVIRGDKAMLGVDAISRGYDEALAAHKCIDVVYDTFTPGWDTATAQRSAEAALQKNPDINAFVVSWDNGAQAVVQALKSAGKEPGDVWVTGTDASTPSLAYIVQGWQSQTTWTPVDQMAKDAANIAHAFAAGKEPEVQGQVVDGVPIDYVRLTSVTKDNLCEFITKIAPRGWVNADEVFGAGAKPCE